MNTNFPNINTLWAHLVIEELVRNGVTKFIISPGGRSTPLTAAAASHDLTEVIMHFDERGAAYYALGCSKAQNKPVALICTSGTATANYFPAIIEASMDFVPLIVLTADRPDELRDSGANQTIDQVNLYGNYPRFFFDMPSPTVEIEPEFIFTTIDQACYRSLTSPSGPVHLNFKFRDPLAPVGENINYKNYFNSISNYLNSKIPYTNYFKNDNILNEQQIESVGAILNSFENALIIVGALRSKDEIDAVTDFIEKSGWPVFPDIRSGLRLNNSNKIINYYDNLLLSESVKDKIPKNIIHFGGNLLSMRLNKFLEKSSLSRYIHIADYPNRHDHFHRVTDKINTNLKDFSCRILPHLDIKKNQLSDYLHSINGEILKQIKIYLSANENILEPAIADAVSQNIENKTVLYLGNSMPVRDMNEYGGMSDSDISIVTNRGVSGIDGNIATFAGYCATSGKPGTIIIGDVSCLHDINSLAFFDNMKVPLAIILINNNGGGIFSFLPIKNDKMVFEKYFGTPHNLSFKHAAAMFNIEYCHPSNIDDFISCYRSVFDGNRPVLIEVVTDRTENYNHHKNLQKLIKETVDKL